MRHRTLWIVLWMVLTPLLVVGVAAADFKVLLFNGTETQTQKIEAGDVEQVKVFAQMESGSITVRGGGEQLADVTVKTNMEAFKPQIRYDEMDGRGSLTIIQQPEPKGVYLGVKYNDWTVRLNDQKPLALALSAKMGDLDAEFEDAQLTSLTLDTGSGSTRMVLHGDHLGLVSASMDAGDGDIESQLDGSFPVLQTLNISTGGGDIDDLALTGTYGALNTVKITNGSGNIAANLSGTWQTDAVINVGTGAGDIDLQLPGDAGIRVLATTGGGKIDVKGLHKADGAYINDLYGKAEHSLDITVDTGSGDIHLKAD